MSLIQFVTGENSDCFSICNKLEDFIKIGRKIIERIKKEEIDKQGGSFDELGYLENFLKKEIINKQRSPLLLGTTVYTFQFIKIRVHLTLIILINIRLT